jgi:acyl carrier protein
MSAEFRTIVADSLLISQDQVTDELEYNSIPQWDSVAHMVLVAALEEAYGIMLDTDEIVAMSSIGKVREILGRYDVET